MLRKELYKCLFCKKMALSAHIPSLMSIREREITFWSQIIKHITQLQVGKPYYIPYIVQ